MRNLILIAALTAGTALGGFAPAMAAGEKTQATETETTAIDTTQTSSIGSSVSNEWMKVCTNPSNSVICQGHFGYDGEASGSMSIGAPAPAPK